MLRFSKFHYAHERLLVGLVALGLVLGFAGLAMAGSSDNQTVTIAVSAINEILKSGNPATLTVSTATAGNTPNEVSDASTTYSITTNETKKITGVLNTAMPANVTLTINLAAPTVGSSAGDVTLLATAADLVTGITPVAASGNTITYKLSATVAAGVVTSQDRTVTLTISAP